jgi:Flp pilus assembly protein TadG
MACAVCCYQVPCYFAGDLLQAAAATVKAVPTASCTAAVSSSNSSSSNSSSSNSSSSNSTTTAIVATTATSSDVDAATGYQMSGLPFVDSWPSLFVGPSGSRSGLHIDAFGSNFWMALLQGAKNWTLFPR